jgi:tetratricopeptide (TPR) repeat protein
MLLIAKNLIPPRLAIGVLVLGLIWCVQLCPASAQDVKTLNQQVWVAEALLARNGGDPLAHARLAEAYLNRARALGDWADIERAEKSLALALQLAPAHPEVLLIRADLHLYQHHFRESLEAANRVIQATPTDPRGYGAAGDAALELGDLATAQNMYDKMLALKRDFESLSGRSHLYEAQGDLKKAAALMQQAITATGKKPEAKATRQWAKVVVASLEMQQGKLNRAEKILQAALAEQPEDDFALEHLGETYGLLERYREADSIYTKAFNLRPEPAYAIAWAGIKQSLGQQAFADTLKQVAERTFRTHVALGRVAYLRELATFYLREGKNLHEALRLATQDTTIRQDTPAFETLAWALEQNGQYETAWQVINRALARPNADALTYYRAGKIAVALKKNDQARRLFKKCLQSNPKFNGPEAEEAKKFLKASK